MHDRGLQLAIYEDVGTKTCAGYPGSWGNEDIDAQTFSDWGVDYLKYDGCNLDWTQFFVGFTRMRDALSKVNKSIIYSIEYASQYLPSEQRDQVSN
uniref:Alpha-galactosidase n=1 Tax=Acrobeloides nanus TaxID=290746 RepID=A0A914C5T9_9BILA